MLHVATSSGMLDWDVMFISTDLRRPIRLLYSLLIWTKSKAHTPHGHQMVTHSVYLELHLTLMEAVLIYLQQCVKIQQTVSLRTATLGLLVLSIAKCVAQGLTTQYDVELSVTDSVGAISTEEISIPDPYASDNSGTDTVDDTSEEESGLPNLGMFATIVAMLGAALLLRKD